MGSHRGPPNLCVLGGVVTPLSRAKNAVRKSRRRNARSPDVLAHDLPTPVCPSSLNGPFRVTAYRALRRSPDSGTGVGS